MAHVIEQELAVIKTVGCPECGTVAVIRRGITVEYDEEDYPYCWHDCTHCRKRFAVNLPVEYK